MIGWRSDAKSTEIDRWRSTELIIIDSIALFEVSRSYSRVEAGSVSSMIYFDIVCPLWIDSNVKPGLIIKPGSRTQPWTIFLLVYVRSNW